VGGWVRLLWAEELPRKLRTVVGSTYNKPGSGVKIFDRRGRLEIIGRIFFRGRFFDKLGQKNIFPGRNTFLLGHNTFILGRKNIFLGKKLFVLGEKNIFFGEFEVGAGETFAFNTIVGTTDEHKRTQIRS